MPVVIAVGSPRYFFAEYLLVCMEDDQMFMVAARGLCWQLSAADEERGSGTARRHQVLAAATTLYQTAARMLALASDRRFSTYLDIALLLAWPSDDNC